MKPKAVLYDRLWTKRDKPLGVLLCPADEGGQSVVVRAGSWTTAVTVQVFRQ